MMSNRAFSDTAHQPRMGDPWDENSRYSPTPSNSGRRPTTLNSDQPQTARLSSTGSGTKTMPASYELADARDLVTLIANMIMELININDKMSLHQDQLTRFHSRSPPQISVHSYLDWVTLHANLLPPILLTMVYYMDKLCVMYPAFTVTSLTVHRFLIVSAMVASKGLSDTFWTNKTYARIGGISPTELAILELEFLFRMRWQIVPKPEMLTDYYHHLIERYDGSEIENS